MGRPHQAGEAERHRMADAFAISCRYEVRFWQMAWRLEDWSTPQQSIALIESTPNDESLQGSST